MQLRSFACLCPLAFLALACGGGGSECTTTDECASGALCIDGECVPGSDGGPRPDADALDSGPRPDGEVTGTGCSGDLRTVLGPSGEPLFDCPPDQGCSAGACIEACEAARRSTGTVACEFHASTPVMWRAYDPACHAVFVANAWPADAPIQVTRAGALLDATAFGRLVRSGMPESAWPPMPATGIPPGEVAVLFLSSDPDVVHPMFGGALYCPVTPAVDAATELRPQGGLAPAFVIESGVPVSAYDTLPYGGAPSYVPSAALLVPVSAWGTEYLVASPPRGTDSTAGPFWIHVIAATAGTVVRIQPTVDLDSGADGVPAVAAGAVGEITLAAGQVVQWQSATRDPSGSFIIADQPVGVLTGNAFLRLQPVSGPGGESTHQWMFPLEALGIEYAVVPYETRRADLAPEDYQFRIVGAYDGTALTYDPPVAGAPATIDRGIVVDFESTDGFVVSSQDEMHPFALVALMTSSNVPSGSRPGATEPGFDMALGDEEAVVLVPPAQFLDSYVFFSDPSYGTTSLALVRTAGAAGFSDVSIECLGTVGGWRALGASGRYEMTTVDLVRAGAGSGTCTNGRQVASSTAPFSLVVWGMDSYSSYGYPAGGNVATLRDLPAPF